MLKRLTALTSIGTLLALTGCGQSRAAQLQETADRKELAGSKDASDELFGMIDDLEARLYTGQANVHLWAEMQDRHGHVSALACKNAEMHVASMQGIDQKNRLAEQKLAAHRVAASHGSVTTDAQVTGYRTPSAPKTSSKTTP